ncbi:MAG TPA: AraC family transcriptional regulator [Gammaproteobacteria bacterium]|nr:AraC family transcriptional regulator [Gammaproteobacteria bacterium]
MRKIYTPFQPTLTQSGLNRFGLTLKENIPSGALNGLVYSYLQIKTEKQTPYPVMPDGTQAVYMSPQDAMIGGAQTEAKDIQLLQPGEYFGIWFYPGALRYFFDVNLSEISGQFVDEKYFECSHFTRLHSDIYRYSTFNERVNVCEKWLSSRYSQKPVTRFDKALSLIYQTKGSERINQLAAKVGWSSRHLNRQFLQHTGLSTKTFSRIIRLQHVCRQLYIKLFGGQGIPVELGYYDQPHLIREFGKFFKLSPGVFFSRFMSDFYNH